MINTDVILNKRVFKQESHRAGAKQWVLCRVNPPRGSLDPAVPLILCRSVQALTGPSPGPRASALGRSEACAAGGNVPGGLTLTLTLTQQLALCRAA